MPLIAVLPPMHDSERQRTAQGVMAQFAVAAPSTHNVLVQAQHLTRKPWDVHAWHAECYVYSSVSTAGTNRVPSLRHGRSLTAGLRPPLCRFIAPACIQVTSACKESHACSCQRQHCHSHGSVRRAKAQEPSALTGSAGIDCV